MGDHSPGSSASISASASTDGSTINSTRPRASSGVNLRPAGMPNLTRMRSRSLLQQQQQLQQVNIHKGAMAMAEDGNVQSASGAARSDDVPTSPSMSDISATPSSPSPRTPIDLFAGPSSTKRAGSPIMRMPSLPRTLSSLFSNTAGTPSTSSSQWLSNAATALTHSEQHQQSQPNHYHYQQSQSSNSSRDLPTIKKPRMSRAQS